MSTTSMTKPDLLTRSPDGESRGLPFRAGDLFPLSPREHLLQARGEAASGVRPWGLRYLRPLTPRAGKHEGASSVTSSQGDGQSAEEMGSD
ncbi:hypothetical protein [Actinoallomurus iriomotensis]|uniref:Uncharacterized protein n=1 Tax=Actinoallomurus iriomotensis TaxID=478107 RepID=A0A9W6VR45_9ACTN|nr:hypothetical protein [Actinoallomurus iriomotensis]GLY81818.1 hypothetical protein Airi01_100850 [Actinoallomurus iriomotensis]